MGKLVKGMNETIVEMPVCGVGNSVQISWGGNYTFSYTMNSGLPALLPAVMEHIADRLDSSAHGMLL